MNDELLHELDDDSLMELLHELEEMDKICEGLTEEEGDNNE